MNLAVSNLSVRPSPRGTPSSLLVGESPAMRDVLRLIERVAPTDAGVLLTGESGSGKELAARSIHEHSIRSAGPFVGVNCGELRAHGGVFQRAHGGTLLLDDVTEMPPDMQARLLRVLETRRVDSVDGDSGRSFDVRVIASTNRSPLEAVRAGALREDLLYRLAVFPIELPPLRSRGNDVELLADHFLARLNAGSGTDKRLSASARMTLRRHSWPGNARELKNCIERAFILADQVLELSPLIETRPAVRDPHADRLEIRVGSRIHDMERSLIEATLDHFKGNKRRTADTLGCSLKTLYNKLNEYSQNHECAGG